ncbi:hypothetical protein EGR_07737 [Echinococcus granulosus]|uniref:Uncharacterized protein n=1 Tax=Echinococcus granulosus TaxID=6210 RepID=W6U853_ECHGR|nr:hypothetical protein EGR_07737 [Echinococcus granulosus]EUB57413.1 hypothetical protein EGR_07737 [Echinococcus granulosus]
MFLKYARVRRKEEINSFFPQSLFLREWIISKFISLHLFDRLRCSLMWCNGIEAIWFVCKAVSHKLQFDLKGTTEVLHNDTSSEFGLRIILFSLSWENAFLSITVLLLQNFALVG